MNASAVVAAGWLRENLANAAVVDATYHLPDLGRDARAEYRDAHIPGAVYFDIGDVADPAPPPGLTHMLPDAAVFSRKVGALGISRASHVVAYDTRGLYSAARVWWMFRVFGHERVSVLDGGLPAWRAAGGAVESGDAAPSPASYAAPPPRRALVRGWQEVREALARGPVPETRLAGRGGRLRVLVIGGSQGARALNEAVPRALAIDSLGARVTVRHQCGPAHVEATCEGYASLEVEAEITGYVEDMGAAYAWADVAVCRAGAMTVAELAAVGVASILVPFPYATDDHQSRNARFLADRGAAILLAEDRLDAAALAAALGALHGDRGRVESMSRAAYDAAVRDAAQRVAAQCLAGARG